MGSNQGTDMAPKQLECLDGSVPYFDCGWLLELANLAEQGLAGVPLVTDIPRRERAHL